MLKKHVRCTWSSFAFPARWCLGASAGVKLSGGIQLCLGASGALDVAVGLRRVSGVAASPALASNQSMMLRGKQKKPAQCLYFTCFLRTSLACSSCTTVVFLRHRDARQSWIAASASQCRGHPAAVVLAETSTCATAIGVVLAWHAGADALLPQLHSM